jgi:hypothetical protein
VRRIGLLVALAISCAPSVDGPAERARAADVEDGARLAAQLSALPGVWSAQVTLHRPAADPLAASGLGLRASGDPDSARAEARSPRPEAPSAAVLIIIDDHADRAATLAAAQQLLHGTAPEIAAPELVITVGAPRAELARVGPFTVERGSRRALTIALAAALAAITALALALARYARRGNSAQ